MCKAPTNNKRFGVFAFRYKNLNAGRHHLFASRKKAFPWESLIKGVTYPRLSSCQRLQAGL